MTTLSIIERNAYTPETVKRMHACGWHGAPDHLLLLAKRANDDGNVERCWYLRGVHDFIVGEDDGDVRAGHYYAGSYIIGRSHARAGCVRWNQSDHFSDPGLPPIDPNPQPHIPAPVRAEFCPDPMAHGWDDRIGVECTGWYLIAFDEEVLAGPFPNKADALAYEGDDDPAAQGAAARVEEMSECEMSKCPGFFANGGDWGDIHRCDACDRFESDNHAAAHAWTLFAAAVAFHAAARQAVADEDGRKRWDSPGDGADSEGVWTQLTISFAWGSDQDTLNWALRPLVEHGITVEIYTVTGGSVCGNVERIEYDEHQGDARLTLDIIDDMGARIRTASVLFRDIERVVVL